MNITLTEPFPIEGLPLCHRWLEACPAIARSAEFPENFMEFDRVMVEKLGRIRSWAVHRENGNLCGAVLLEPLGDRGAQAFVVSARSAWGRGYMDLAVRDIMAIVFTGPQPLDYVIGMVKERNWPARAFNERVGMRLKNIFPDLRAYELTRERWEQSCLR